MHRIDGPGATVDNRFTDGDPVGGVQATIVTDDWANDVQEELMSILAAGGVSPVKGTQNQVLKAIRSINSGVVGAARNVNAYVTSVAASTFFTFDEAIMTDPSSGQSYRLRVFSKLINLAITGAGGMDSGAAPTNGFVAVYVIYNPISGVSALLASNAGLSRVAEAYNGANMPSGYTASALLSVWPTNGSGQFVVGYQADRDISVTPVNVLNATSVAASLTSLSISGVVPKNARQIQGYAALNASSGTGAMALILAGDAAASGRQTLGGYITLNVGSNGSFSKLPVITQQTIYHMETLSGSPTGLSISISISGYTI